MARPAQDPQNRINEILDIADQLFLTQGYHVTTISDIAKKMGVAQGMLYYYFKSKEEVLEKLLERHTTSLIAEFKKIIRLPSTPSEKIALTVSAILAMAGYKDGLLLSMLYDVQNLHIKDKLFYKLEVELSPWMLMIVNEGIATRQFSVDHPPTVVEYTLAIVEVLSIALHRKSSPEVLAFRLEMAEILLEKMMGAQEKTIHIQLPGQANR